MKQPAIAHVPEAEMPTCEPDAEVPTHDPDSDEEPTVESFTAEVPRSSPVCFISRSMQVHAEAPAAAPRAYLKVGGLFVVAAVAVWYVQSPVAVPGREWLEEVLVNSTPLHPSRELEVPAGNATLGKALADSPRVTGWAAFEVDANGSAVPAPNPQSAEVRYELLDPSRSCGRDLVIGTQEECRFHREEKGS